MLSALPGAMFGEVTAGEGPPIVALHGWGRTHRDFDRFRSLAPLAGRHIVAVDLPGFGATPAPRTAVGARAYAEMLVPLVASLGSPVVLCGHSRGGAIALCLASAHPELVRGVVCTGAPLLRPATAAKPALSYRVVRAATKAHLLPSSILERRRQQSGSADYRAATGVMREVLVTMVNESYDDELRRLSVPLHLVWGALDDAVAVGVADAVRALVPTATLEVLPGVGHDTVRDAPEVLARVVGSIQ